MHFKTVDEQAATYIPPGAQTQRARAVLGEMRSMLNRLEQLPKRIRCIDGEGIPQAEKHITSAYYIVRDWIEDMEREQRRPVARAMKVFAIWDPVIVSDVSTSGAAA